jgi:hypothetical protein
MVWIALRRAYRQTVSTAREHVRADLALAITGVVISIGKLASDDELSTSDLLGATGLAAAPFLLGGLVTFAVHFAKAPGALRQERAASELSASLRTNNSVEMFAWVVSLLSDPALCVAEIYAFGSSLLEYPPPQDVDVAIRFRAVKRRKILKAHSRLQECSREFERVFHRPLHLQFYLAKEESRWTVFLETASPIMRLSGVYSDG